MVEAKAGCASKLILRVGLLHLPVAVFNTHEAVAALLALFARHVCLAATLTAKSVTRGHIVRRSGNVAMTGLATGTT